MAKNDFCFSGEPFANNRASGKNKKKAWKTVEMYTNCL